MRSIAIAVAFALAACASQELPVTAGKLSGGGRTLSGTVSGSTAADTMVAAGSLANASVVASLIPDEPDSSIIDRTLGSVTTDAGGHFTFPGLPTGPILLVFSPPSGTPYITSIRSIGAGSSAVSNINVLLPDTTGHGVPGGGGNNPPPDSTVTQPGANRAITGTVLGIGTIVGPDSGKVSGPVSGATVTAKANQGGGLTTVGTTTTDAAGHFSLANMPGSFVVLTFTPPAGTNFRTIDYYANPGTTNITAYMYP